ncbi:MAG TPA: phosphoribosyltransferase family protein [Gemmatimonadales bacterium]|nr:phosphoribosyltransferase family protein [Gemmatimonadales bacterium]
MSRFFDVQARFRDRRDAGQQLAERLEPYRQARPVVFAIPRGGVPVGAEVARGLNAELDVVVARKLGAPFQAELALGAVTSDGERFLNDEIISQLGVDDAYLDQVTREQGDEARRRERRFRGGRPPAAVEGRTVLLVDDGLATGATMRAAARSLRKRAPGRLVVAVPVGSREACMALREDADEVICLAQPEPFYAIGLHYQSFEQVDDAEVIALLQQPVAADR